MMRALHVLHVGFWKALQVIVFLATAPLVIGSLLLSLGAGVLIGGLLGIVLIALLLEPHEGQTVWDLLIILPCMVGGAGVCLAIWIDRSGVVGWLAKRRRDSHGTARFADRREMRALEQAGGLLIGRNPATGRLLSYDGPAHLLTLAPTRAGKGVGTVIPNLLAVERSVLVIDPKGENARITAAARERFGDVHVLDPFGVSGHASAAYNPLDRLGIDSPDLGEDAATLADALVMDPPGQVQEAHWNEEAKALLAGLILFCVAHEEAERRSLAAVREYLTLPPDRFRELLTLMQDSTAAHGLIARAANRFLGKSDREAASVLSSAQRHTHFLDSPRIAACMARSDFAFADLRHRIASVFLVLPPNRLDAYSRWLRLLVSQALQDIARDAEGSATPAGAGTPAGISGVTQGLTEPHNASEALPAARSAPQGVLMPTAGPESLTGPLSDPETTVTGQDASEALPEPLTAPQRPQGPVLFLLDEFAALGRLEAVERAMGLMAGYGLQLWPILQDMSQLRDLYGARASTFVANAGVQQVFGVNDYGTAQWLSQSMGRETIGYHTQSHRPGDAPTTGTAITGRDLLTPDEIMRLAPELQLLRLQSRPPAIAQKLRYYADPEFAGLVAATTAA